MKQIEIFEITSPCIGVCQSGPSGYCLGCFRSRDERLHWTKLDQDVQSKIIKVCAIRKKRLATTKQKPANEPKKPLQNDFFD
ncbi:DUF1289 domain-containing protein [Paraglaciecola hydrolytica]|uniref:Fe-S-like proteinEB3 n=1 Tax=Paraglaciecola hydrolytica TaxID=1799789 RepID=A0A136A2C5_9ALTE|nr:DUF1289 domain-containing protein [Paraglaciecola hydrolytica]KXI29399.1 Fe-S-like proteinEB3 [Paraglaciecola hydrolytica]